MHHQVGITTYGRGKVGIIVERQTVVTDIYSRIDRLRHSSYSYRLHQIFLRLSLYVGQQTINTLRKVCFAALGLDFITESGDKSGERSHLVGIGQVVYPIDKRFGLFPVFGFTDKFCYRAIRQKHKLFDQLVRLLRYLEINPYRLATFIYVELNLMTVEIDRTIVKTTLPQLLRQIVQSQYFLFIIPFSGLYHLLRLLISKPAIRPNHRTGDMRLLNLGITVQLENTRERKFILVGTQRTDFVAQSFGQHRHDTIHQINRGSPAFGLLVDDTAGFYIITHVGYMHANLPISVR